MGVSNEGGYHSSEKPAKSSTVKEKGQREGEGGGDDKGLNDCSSDAMEKTVMPVTRMMANCSYAIVGNVLCSRNSTKYFMYLSLALE